jgi:hypothetical protein
MSSTATPTIQWHLGGPSLPRKKQEVVSSYDDVTREAIVRPVELTWEEQLSVMTRQLYLREELHHASLKMLAWFQLLLLTVMLQFITPYWILGSLLVAPIFLSGAAHALTVFIASLRKPHAKKTEQ